MSHVYAAVKAVIQYKNTYLLLEQQNTWKSIIDLPGGKIEHGESLEETLFREVMEETGLTVEIIKQVPTRRFFRNHDQGQVICTTFLCAAWSDRVDLWKNPSDERIQWYKRVTKHELLALHNEFNESFRRVLTVL